MNRKFLFLFLFISGFSFAQNAKETVIILFDSNNSEIKTSEKESLITFFSNESLVVQSINIYGFCDDIGTLENNRILSSNRANSVALFLKKEFNLSSDATIGKGEITLTNILSEEETRKNNRKVEIEIKFFKISEAKIESKKAVKDVFSEYKSFSDNLVVGDKIIVNKIQFVGSLTTFEDEDQAALELEKIVNYLKSNPSSAIEIQGHVCCISASFKDAFDRFSGKNNLSETRAEKIYNLLIERGISSERMSHFGYGRQFPIPNAEEHFNKRVEILITKI
jgi:outer membrane protein OmpA-like peptidoglycan-associated protein